MSRRMRTVLLSMVMVCLCLALLIGGTYALFSDQETVNSYLKAGKLDAVLYRVEYQDCTLGENGMLVTSERNTDRIDLTNASSKDIMLFDIEKAVPQSWYEACLEVSNAGNVAFDYGVRMLWNVDGQATDAQKELASQIQITISGEDGTELAEFALSAGRDVDLGTILVGGAAQEFTVRAEFLNDPDNNIVQDVALEFALQVYAIQKV